MIIPWKIQELDLSLLVKSTFRTDVATVLLIYWVSGIYLINWYIPNIITGIYWASYIYILLCCLWACSPAFTSAEFSKGGLRGQQLLLKYSCWGNGRTVKSMRDYSFATACVYINPEKGDHYGMVTSSLFLQVCVENKHSGIFFFLKLQAEQLFWTTVSGFIKPLLKCLVWTMNHNHFFVGTFTLISKPNKQPYAEVLQNWCS